MCDKCDLSSHLSLKPRFPQGFSLLHSLPLFPHFCGLTLICTDSYDACSLSAIHFIQSMSHGALLTSISISPSPASLFFPLYFLSCYLALSNLCLPLLLFLFSPSLSVPLLLFLYHSRYYSPTPPPCLSAAAAAPPRLMAKPGPPPPPPLPPRRGESDPYIHPHLHLSTAAPAALSASPSFSCCSAFSTFPRPATHGEKREGEVVAATTSLSPSPLPTRWPCPTSCVASASLLSWWATPARWRWLGLGRRRTSSTWRPT